MLPDQVKGLNLEVLVYWTVLALFSAPLWPLAEIKPNHFSFFYATTKVKHSLYFNCQASMKHLQLFLLMNLLMLCAKQNKKDCPMRDYTVED